MKEGYAIRDQPLQHFITVTVVDWIDVFTRQVYIDKADNLVVDVLNSKSFYKI